MVIKKMIGVLRKMPELFPIIVSIYWCLNPKIENVIVIPYRWCWLAMSGKQKFFVPFQREGSGDWFGPLLYTKKRMLEKYTLKPFVDVNKGDVVFDVGAFIGGFSLAVADKASKIIAVEPDPINCVYLRANAAKLKNVIIIQKALWKSEGIMELRLGVKPSDSSLINIDGESLDFSVKVQVIRLDNLAQKLGVDRIDFLKIDAEGAEPEVLEGAKNILSKTRKVAVDCTPERFGKPTTSEVKDILRSAGFNVLVRDYIVYAWMY